MRKTNNFFDNLMWYMIYLMPLLISLFYFGKTGDFSLSGTMSALNLDILTTSDLFSSLNGVFGPNGVVPLFANTDILMYFSYFISVFIVHLAVDFLLFIPRLADYWLNKLYFHGGDK